MCNARRVNDQMMCECGLAWDVADDEPPVCPHDKPVRCDGHSTDEGVNIGTAPANFKRPDVPPPAPPKSFVRNHDEREAFKKACNHLDLTEVADTWGRPTFLFSHVEAMWAGWQARAAMERTK